MTRARNSEYKKWFLCALSLMVLCAPLLVHAQYVSLVGIDGMDEFASGGSANNFIDTLYRIAIVGAALIAVVKLILAGAKYVLSGIVTEKEDAKRDIRSALVGLLIIIAAVTILTTINPSISNLPSMEPITIPERDTGPDEDSEEYWCEQYGEDNCSTIDCNVLESGLWNLAIWGGADSINSAICEGRCLYFGGEVVEEGDTCVYPTDSDTYREKRLEAETAEIAAELEEELPEGATARACTGGPLGCQNEEAACRNGLMLPDSQTGTPSQAGTGQNLVVVCTP